MWFGLIFYAAQSSSNISDAHAWLCYWARTLLTGVGVGVGGDSTCMTFWDYMYMIYTSTQFLNHCCCCLMQLSVLCKSSAQLSLPLLVLSSQDSIVLDTLRAVDCLLFSFRLLILHIFSYWTMVWLRIWIGAVFFPSMVVAPWCIENKLIEMYQLNLYARCGARGSLVMGST